MHEDNNRTPAWGKKLQASLRDAQAGRGTFYGSEKEFLEALKNDFAKPKNKRGRGSK